MTLPTKTAGEVVEEAEYNAIIGRINARDYPPVYDAIVYQDATTTYAVDKNGTVLSSGLISAGTDNIQIQAAIDSLSSTTGTVYICAGTYLFSAEIHFHNGVNLIGSGYQTTTIKQKNSINGFLIYTTSISNVLVEGITFDYNHQNNLTTNTMVILTSDHITLSKCKFMNFRAFGIYFGGDPASHNQYCNVLNCIIDPVMANTSDVVTFVCNDGLVEGNYIYNVLTNVGLYIFDSDRTVVIGNHIESTGTSQALGLGSARNCMISGNSIIQTGAQAGYGMFIVKETDNPTAQTSFGNTICGNTIDNFNHAIHFCDSANDTVSNNIISNSASGMYFDVTVSPIASSILITGNQFITVAEPYHTLVIAPDNILLNNVGYVTENEGAAASIADGGTITHGLTPTPTWATATCSVSGESVAVTTLGATTLTVAIKKCTDGSAGTTQTIYWRCGV